MCTGNAANPRNKIWPSGTKLIVEVGTDRVTMYKVESTDTAYDLVQKTKVAEKVMYNL